MSAIAACSAAGPASAVADLPDADAAVQVTVALVQEVRHRTGELATPDVLDDARRRVLTELLYQLRATAFVVNAALAPPDADKDQR